MIEIPLKDPRYRLHYPLQETRFHRVVQFLLGKGIKPFMQLGIISLHNFPLMGGVIVVANHLTDFDMFALQLALPRPLFFMEKAELFQNPLTYAFFHSLGAFPVYRGARDEWAVQHAQHILAAGQVLGMFPEGTPSLGGGLKVAKTGAARLAMAANCPIVPVAIHGSRRFLENFPRRTRMEIRICEPIWAERNELPLALTDRVMTSLARNLPLELRGVYAEIPRGF